MRTGLGSFVSWLYTISSVILAWACEQNHIIQVDARFRSC